MKKFRLKKKEIREVKRITEYLVSGGAFFWSGYVVLLAMNWWLGPTFLWLSTSVSYTVGWFVNYLLQRYWVFDNPKLAKHQTEVTSRYIVVSLLNLVINYIIIQAWVNIGYRIEIAPFVSSAFFTVWNYLLYKYYVFPTKFPRKRSSTGAKSVRRSRTRRAPSRAAAVSKTPVLTQRIEYTPRSVLRFFLASTSSENRLKNRKES